MTYQKARKAIFEGGQLTITLRGEPEHLHACTCTKCQRASSSVTTITAWYPHDQIVPIEGQTMTWQPDDEGTDVYRCARCSGGGYVLTGSYPPHCVGINVGHFADRDYPAPPHIHWWPSRPRWLAPPDAIELLDGN